MTDANDLDAFIEAGTALLDIRIRPEWQEAIRQHLTFSLDRGRLVLEFALADEADPAPVFAA